MMSGPGIAGQAQGEREKVWRSYRGIRAREVSSGALCLRLQL